MCNSTIVVAYFLINYNCTYYYYYFIDEVMWDVLCYNTPANLEQSLRYLHELAEAIQVIHSYSKDWTEDDVISILDEITGT